MRCRSSSNRPGTRALGLLFGRGLLPWLALAAGCGSPTPRTVWDPVPETGEGQQVQEATKSSGTEEPGFEGLDRLHPEIVVLDDLYRETLQAIQDDDLTTAEKGIAELKAALDQTHTADPVRAAYLRNMRERAERLEDLVQESRDFQSYVSKMGIEDMTEGAAEATPPQPATQEEVAQPSNDPRYDLALVHNALTDRWMEFFTGDGRHYMQLWLSRKPLYEEIILDILNEYKLPKDLIYLAMIESGLNMKARSYASAVGPWQFISSTGRLYGLKIDWWVDDRRHLEKSTHAAASHLSDLYESLGSWPLALAAYNTGIRRVERAIRNHGTRDFWALKKLPRQTRNYVPKFMAALYIGHDPGRYGFTVPKVPKLEYDMVRVEDATDLSLIAEFAGASLDSVVELNPHLKRWSTPPGQVCEVRVPEGTGERVSERLAQIPAEERVTWRRHRVHRGETLSIIAQRYGTSVEAIKQANNLRRSTIHSGTHLLIPVGGSTGSRQAGLAAAAEEAARSEEPERSIYVVRRGDALSRIAARHGVTVNQIMRWNGKRSTRIHVGERLKLYADADEDGPSPRTMTYVVRRGDTLHYIGRRHGVSVRDLMSWNRKRSTRIHVGERLRILLPS